MWRSTGLLAFLVAGATQAAEPLPVHVGGRTVAEADGSHRFGWPGTYFESRFDGTAVTVSAESGSEFMRVLVDGEEKLVFKRPGRVDATLSALPAGPHTIRLEKLTESQTAGGRFLGFFPAGDTRPLPPAARARRIEYIGDSYAVGYGNTAPGRTCPGTGVHDTTDTQQAFGPILARKLDADYRVVAYSGFGVVRNYNGGRRGESLPSLYPRLIPDDPAHVAGEEAAWKPHLIVINLGTNDFSTPLHAGEPWATPEALRAAYRSRYVEFARSLMRRNPEAQLVLMGSDAFYGEVEQVAESLNRAAKRPVVTVRFGELELTGCDYHPSLADHRALADLLEKTLAGLPQPWR
jgi:lysophospholipase L1-like esterase